MGSPLALILSEQPLRLGPGASQVPGEVSCYVFKAGTKKNARSRHPFLAEDTADSLECSLCFLASRKGRDEALGAGVARSFFFSRGFDSEDMEGSNIPKSVGEVSMRRPFNY